MKGQREWQRGQACRFKAAAKGLGVSRSVGVVPSEAPPSGSGSALADFARQLWWERRLRSRYFPIEIFADPSWDLLLEVYAAQIADKPIRLNKAHLSACVPPSIAQRRSRDLVQLGILVTERARTDRRGVQLTLSPAARSRLEHLLQSILAQRYVQPPKMINGRSARKAEFTILLTALKAIREEMDSMELWIAGAYISQAITTLEEG